MNLSSSIIIPATIFVLSYLSIFSIQEAQCSSATKRLYEDLFSDYNRLILPASKNRTKVTVTVGLKLGQILDLNLKQQILSTNVWVEQTWHDYKLEWDPNLYDGIDMIHVPAENIWIPDIVLFNNADGNYELTLVAKARVFYNGTVVWRPPTMFRSTCEIDVEFFPFDVQTCYLRFGSWTYAGDEVELSLMGNKTKLNPGIDLSQFYKNVEWDIIEVPAYYNEVYYDYRDELYPNITFKIVIRRKILFYLVNLILPVALMTFLTVSVFYLPSDSNEKVTLSISILTSLIVFFLLMLEIIPASSLAVPLFGKYLLFTLVLVSLSACVSVYVLNLHHRSPNIHSMSPRMRQLFLKTLPRLLFLNQPNPRERSSLNRFRQKKIAQQMLKQATSPSNKVYDLAQSMAASLNLIETLHRSYQLNPSDDKLNGERDDEGRYFRRYVDDYVEHLKILSEQRNVKVPEVRHQNNLASFHDCSRCCQRAYQTLAPEKPEPIKPTPSTIRISGPYPTMAQTRAFPTKFDKPQNLLSHSNLVDNTIRGQSLHGNGYLTHGNIPIVHDDTLDMTFDYDDQDNMPMETNMTRCNSMSRHLENGDEDLPSPPPPPKELAHLSSTMKQSGRVSNCSTRHISHNNDSPDLVGNLINNVKLIYNRPDTLTNNASFEADLMDCANSPGRVQNHSHGQQSILENVASLRGQMKSSNVKEKSLRSTKNNFHHTHGNLDNCLCDCDLSQRQEIRPGFGRQHRSPSDQPSVGSKGADSLNDSSNVPLNKDFFTGSDRRSEPSELLLSLRLPYDRMPAHVRAAIRNILFIADTIKNEDDENSAIEDWESMSMVVDRLFFCIFFILCSIGSLIILASAPSLFDERAPIDDELRTDIAPSSCSASNLFE